MQRAFKDIREALVQGDGVSARRMCSAGRGAHCACGDTIRVKGKPVVRSGRKAKGLIETA